MINKSALRLPAIAVCWSCAAAFARPIGAWVLTDLIPFQHHALIGLVLMLVALWRTRTTGSSVDAREPVGPGDVCAKTCDIPTQAC